MSDKLMPRQGYADSSEDRKAYSSPLVINLDLDRTAAAPGPASDGIVQPTSNPA